MILGNLTFTIFCVHGYLLKNYSCLETNMFLQFVVRDYTVMRDIVQPRKSIAYTFEKYKCTNTRLYIKALNFIQLHDMQHRQNTL